MTFIILLVLAVGFILSKVECKSEKKNSAKEYFAELERKKKSKTLTDADRMKYYGQLK